MKASHPAAVFLIAVSTGAALVVGAFGVGKWRDHQALPAHVLAPGISISEQLRPQSMDVAREQFATVIDMRPDGEAPDEPGSDRMAAAASERQLQFAYVPVPHGDIPDAVIDQLSAAIAARPGPVLLYCRSGRRAARSWSLLEASRPGGLGVDQILAAVRGSGQDASDLRARIAQRVQARKPAPEAQR